jgi:myo-inositol 2-dehydrogenase / D-chiro-inositol 1-dehydrogenase
MEASPLKLGIIGCGQITCKGHLPNLAFIPEIEVVALHSPSQKSMTEAGRFVPRAKCFSNIKDLFECDEVEAVLIASPNQYHAEQSVKALEAGNHVFCEKPVGINLKECDDVQVAIHKSGCHFQIGHELHFGTQTLAIKELQDRGELGSLQMIVTREYRFPLKVGWRQGQNTGGLMLEKNSHCLDLFRWYAGSKAKRVIASGGNNLTKDSPLPDHSTVIVEFENNVKAVMITCLFASTKQIFEIDLIGSQRRIAAHLGGSDLEVFGTTDDFYEKRTCPSRVSFTEAFHPGLASQLKHFVQVIKGSAPAINTIQDARDTLVLALAAEKSLKTNQPILLN